MQTVSSLLPLYDLLPRHSKELLDRTRTSDGRQRYCTYPFRLLGLSSDLLKPCTWLRYVPETNVLPLDQAGGDLAEIWNSTQFDNVRRAIADGSYLHCNLDGCPEYKGEQKYFKTVEELEVEFPHIAEYIVEESDQFKGSPEIVNLSHDPGCNLACPSCNRLELPRLRDAQRNMFSRTLVQIAADIRFIFLAGMGDPFGTPHYYEWLRTVDVTEFPKLESIILNTNGLLWSEETWRKIPQGTRDKIRTAVVSVDGVSRETYEVNRYPGKWDDIRERLEYIAGLRRGGELSKLRAYFVYQENNFRELPEAIRFFRELSFDELFLARITKWRGQLSQAEHDALDVALPSHPQHGEFSRLADEVSASLVADDPLTVTLMR